MGLRCGDNGRSDLKLILPDGCSNADIGQAIDQLVKGWNHGMALGIQIFHSFMVSGLRTSAASCS